MAIKALTISMFSSISESEKLWHGDEGSMAVVLEGEFESDGDKFERQSPHSFLWWF